MLYNYRDIIISVGKTISLHTHALFSPPLCIAIAIDTPIVSEGRICGKSRVLVEWCSVEFAAGV